jgi:hypothetical protein
LLQRHGLVQLRRTAPLINGKYVLRKIVDGGEHRLSITHYTRVHEGVFNYSVDVNGFVYQLADGIARPLMVRGTPAMFTLFCEGDALVSLTQLEGSEQISRVEMRVLDERRIDATFTDPQRSGIYSKE